VEVGVMDKKEINALYEKLEYEITQKITKAYDQKIDEQIQKIDNLEKRLKMLEEEFMWAAHDLKVNL
jgi:hypothetical protein